MTTEVFGPLFSKAGAALLLAACRGGAGSPPLEDRYQWGQTCDGISIGVSVSATQVPRASPVQWRMAITNHSQQARTLVIGNDLDRTARYRLQAEPADGRSAGEFAPEQKGPPTSGNIRRTVEIPASGIAELDEEAAPIGVRLGPGKYRLTAIFGGEGFDFSCESGAIDVTVD